MAVAFVRDHTGMSIKTAGTNNAYVNISTATTPGNVLVARILFDNAATANTPTVVSIAVPAGETAAWVPLGAARAGAYTAGLYSSGEMFAIRTTVPWPVAQYTVTLSASVTMKATDCREFSGVLAALRSTSGAAWQVATTAASATTTGTAPQVGDLAVGFIFGSNVAAAQAGSNNTTGGSWSAASGLGSTGGSGATNNYGVAQYKILTAASHQTYANSAAMTAGNGAVVAILQQYVDPAITQAAFRFYADGTETASTALAGQDTSPSVDVSSGDVNTQLRVRLQATSAVAVDAADDWRLQWEKNASGSWADVAALTTQADASITTGNSNSSVISTFYWAQSFRGNGGKLAGVLWRVAKSATAAGTVVCDLYTHTGTYGSSGVPGTLIATSLNAVDVSTLAPSGVGGRWEWFYFDETFTLSPGGEYFVSLRPNLSAGSVTLYVSGGDVHSGNKVSYNGSVWGTPDITDVNFQVRTRTEPPPTTVFSYDSPDLTDGAATTNRLTGGTGAFVAGKVSEDGLVDDLGWAGNNYTELLYSLTFEQADLANGDTIRFRVLRNGATTGLTFTQTPTVGITVGGGGPQDFPLAGTVAASTATSGAITRDARDYPLAGIVAATSTTVGTIGLGLGPQAYPLVGTVAGTSTTAGAVAAVHPLAGTAAGTTTTAGTIGQVVGPVAYPLAGTVTATSSTSGTLLRLNLALAGTTAGTATTSGDPAATHPLAGTLPAITTASGTLRSALPLTGTIAATTAAAGSPVAVHPMAGATPAVSNVTGTPNAVYRLTGTTAGISAAQGTINLVGGSQNYPLAGTLPAITTTSGSPAAVHPLTSTLPAISTVTGDPAARHPLTSTTAAVTTTAGAVTATHPLTGTTAGISTTTGNPAARHPLLGSVAGFTTTTGTINVVGGAQAYPLAGTITAVTTITGTLQAVAMGGRPKMWTGSAWVQKPGKVWNGSAWVEKPWKTWSGSAWEKV